MEEIKSAEKLILEKLNTWREALVSMLPNLILALFCILFFYFLAKQVRRLLNRWLSSISENETLNRLFINITYILFILIGIFVALSILHLEQTVSSLLAGAGIVGLALSFAFQDIATNFISGIFLAFKSPFKIGDFVEVSGFSGIVEIVNLRNSAIRTFTGQLVYVPNKDIFQSSIINFSELGRRRIDLAVGVSYGDDLDKVERVTKEAIQSLEFCRDKDNIHVLFDAFGDSSINFNLVFWVSYRSELVYLKQKSDAIKVIKAYFDKEDIMIPFPIRTLDFGIRGGEKLSETPIQLKPNHE